MLNERLLKFFIASAIIIAVMYVVMTGVKAEFNCTSIVKNQTNGTWNAEFINCTQEPRENVTIVYNITNVTQEDTLLDEAVRNITTSFDQSQTIQTLNNTLSLCIRDTARLTSIEQEFQKVRDNSTACNLGLSSISNQLNVANASLIQKGQEIYYYLGGGLLAGFVVASWKRIFRREPSDRIHRIASGETHETAVFQKESREREESLKIKDEIEKQKKEMDDLRANMTTLTSNLDRKKRGK